MRTLFIILIFTLYYKNSISQTKWIYNYYFEIEKHNSINKPIILMASPTEGTMKYSLDILDNKYCYKNSLDFILLKGFVYYNIYGKDMAFHFLDTCKSFSLNETERLFIKSWWSKTSENIEDYSLFINELDSKYPENLFSIRFKLIDYLNLRDAKNQQNYVEQEILSSKIDSILKLKNISISDSIYFSLMKCDVLSTSLNLNNNEKDKNINEIITILDNLWDKHGDQLNSLKLKEKLELVNSSKSKQLLQKINLTPIVNLCNYERQFDSIDMNIYAEGLMAYTSFIKDKPLFYQDGYIQSYLIAKNMTEFTNALKEIDHAIQKYPGSLALKKYKLRILDKNETFTNQNKSVYFFEILQTVTDIFLTNQSEGLGYVSESCTSFGCYFNYLAPLTAPFTRMSSFEYILSYCDQNKKEELTKKIENAIKNYPYQGNLHILYCNLLLNNKDTLSYLRAYLDAYANVTTFKHKYHKDFYIDGYILNNIDTNILRKEFELFILKNNFLNPNVSDAVTIPILMRLQEYVDASKIMANNMADTLTTPYYYVTNYYKQLFKDVKNDSILNICIKYIYNKNNDKDVAYVYTALLQLVNKDEKGMYSTFDKLKTTKNIKKIIFASAGGEVIDTIKFYKEKVGTSEMKKFTDVFIKLYPWCKIAISEI